MGEGLGSLGTQYGQLALQQGEALSQLGLRQGALGELQQSLGQKEAGFLFDVGKQQQAQDQAVLEAERKTQVEQMYEPYQRVGFLSDIYKGAPSSQMAVSQQSGGNVSPAQSILGLGVAGLSAAAGAKQAGVILMMNREVMSRQMFAKGGAAFPDLSGDGNVTQKDILIGRGVIEMQDGGMAPMPAPAAPGPQMMPPGMPPIDPNSVDINQAAQGAMQNGIDPAMLEGMLTQYAQGMDDLENAEDYETVMNGIRGDDQPIEQRYEELASVVGQEDAQQTPESVLALGTARHDDGSGRSRDRRFGCRRDERPEGAMAEGIMSTVNMGGPDQAQGGPAPVNFNQGGAVQYMNVGGAADPRMQSLYEQQLAIFNQIDDPGERAADLEQQRDMTKAGILFDIAQGALGFAGGAGRPGATPAEQLATAFQPVLGNIGARAGELNKFQMSQKDTELQMRLGALDRAGQLYGAERSAELARQDKPISDTFTVTITNKDGSTTETQRPLTQGQYQSLIKEHGMGNVSVAKVFKPTTASKAENFLFNGSIVSAVPGTARYNQLDVCGRSGSGRYANKCNHEP